MTTFVMVRTVCCESYKWCGQRCSICPDRPENQEAVRNFERELEAISLGTSPPSRSRRRSPRVKAPASQAREARYAASGE